MVVFNIPLLITDFDFSKPLSLRGHTNTCAMIYIYNYLVASVYDQSLLLLFHKLIISLIVETVSEKDM